MTLVFSCVLALAPNPVHSQNLMPRDPFRSVFPLPPPPNPPPPPTFKLNTDFYQIYDVATASAHPEAASIPIHTGIDVGADAWVSGLLIRTPVPYGSTVSCRQWLGSGGAVEMYTDVQWPGLGNEWCMMNHIQPLAGSNWITLGSDHIVATSSSVQHVHLEIAFGNGIGAVPTTEGPHLLSPRRYAFGDAIWNSTPSPMLPHITLLKYPSQWEFRIDASVDVPGNPPHLFLGIGKWAAFMKGNPVPFGVVDFRYYQSTNWRDFFMHDRELIGPIHYTFTVPIPPGVDNDDKVDLEIRVWDGELSSVTSSPFNTGSTFGVFASMAPAIVGQDINIRWSLSSFDRVKKIALERSTIGDQSTLVTVWSSDIVDQLDYEFTDRELPEFWGRLVYRVVVVDADGSTYEAGYAEVRHPPRISTLDVFPNPFGNKTTARIRLAEPAHVDISIYDVAGRKVKSVFSGSIKQEEARFEWTGRDEKGLSVAAGVYFTRVRIGNETLTRKVMVLR